MAVEYISRDYTVENMENFPWDTEHDKNAAIRLTRELVPAADVVSRDCFNRILAENDKLREENKKLRVDLASAKAEFENYKSWERDYENGQVQGMW